MLVSDETISRELIRKLQVSQYYILEKFNVFCLEHKLKYTLDFGTMLGAIRHEGFIPWDDDIDVAMLRDDYEEFLSLKKEWDNEKIFIQNYRTDPEFIHSFTRLRLNDSLALQDEWKNLKIHHGIFIDIFPYDTVASTELGRKNHADEIALIQAEKMKYVKSNTVNASNLRKLNEKQNRLVAKYNDKFKRHEEVSHMTQGLKSYCDWRRSVSDFSETRLVNFENDLYPIPNDYDTILKNTYGKYMEYPIKSERIPHHGVIRLKFRKDILLD